MRGESIRFLLRCVFLLSLELDQDFTAQQALRFPALDEPEGSVLDLPCLLFPQLSKYPFSCNTKESSSTASSERILWLSVVWMRR
jgi:hypothetical protein